MADETPILPVHIEETVQAIAQLHADHEARATPLQRFVERLTAGVARPTFLALLTILIVGWMALNSAMTMTDHKPIDEPPFFWMQGLVALTALYMTVLILTTQRREDEMAEHREQLTLELAILSEQKSAKIIALLEELRRDNPMIRNRHDAEAEALSTPADPNSVLEAIKETREGLLATTETSSNAASDAVIDRKGDE